MTKRPDPRVVGHDLAAPCSCGAAPTCIGRYEGGPLSTGCDGCCGHGNEDGWCISVADEQHARDIAAAEARGFERALDDVSMFLWSDRARDFLGGYAPVDKDLDRMIRWLDRRIRAMKDETP